MDGGNAGEANMDESKPLKHDLIGWEYKALSEQLIKRTELGYRIIEINLTITAAILGIALTKDAFREVVLIQPIIAFLLAIIYANNSRAQLKIIIYIREFIEGKNAYDGWYSKRSSIEKRFNFPLIRFKTNKLTRHTITSTFVISQFLSIYIGFYLTDVNVTTDPLAIISIISLVSTIIFIIVLNPRNNTYYIPTSGDIDN